MRLQQRKVQRFFARHLHPFAIKIRRHATKSPHHIQRQIDRVEFNMGERMNQRGATLAAADAASGNVRGCNQVWARWAAR